MAPIEVVPLTPDRWADFEDLFGPDRGGASGCWCQWHRVENSAGWNELGREGRKLAMRDRVAAGPPPGLLAYDGSIAVGWCAVAPRPELPRFNTQRVSVPVDPAGIDTNAWAITCFFIRPGQRNRGLSTRLAEAAIAYARANGARSVEVCAIEPDKPLTWGDGFVGIASTFEKLGFVEIARRSPKRPLMRLMLAD